MSELQHDRITESSSLNDACSRDLQAGQREDGTMIQEQFAGDPWAVLVCTLLVHQTRGVEALPVVRQVMKAYPSAAALAQAHQADATLTEQTLSAVLEPLGFQHKRCATLIDWSVRLSAGRDDAEPMCYPGVGPYTADCYEVFALGRVPHRLRTEDQVLIDYVERVLTDGTADERRRLPWNRERK